MTVPEVQCEWAWANLDFTVAGKRNDDKDTLFAARHKVEDLFFFVKPEGKEDVTLPTDEVVLYDAGQRKEQPPKRSLPCPSQRRSSLTGSGKSLT